MYGVPNSTRFPKLLRYRNPNTEIQRLPISVQRAGKTFLCCCAPLLRVSGAGMLDGSPRENLKLPKNSRAPRHHGSSLLPSSSSRWLRHTAVHQAVDRRVVFRPTMCDRRNKIVLLQLGRVGRSCLSCTRGMDRATRGQEKGKCEEREQTRGTHMRACILFIKTKCRIYPTAPNVRIIYAHIIVAQAYVVRG